MKTIYLLRGLALLLPLQLISCQEQTAEPTLEHTPLYLEIEADEEPYTLEDSDTTLRAFGYALEGDYKRPLVNFGAEATGQNIPVTAFFRNRQTGRLVHTTLYFDKVKGAKQLIRSFAPVDLGNAYTEASKDHWYVKMFVGVYPELENNASPDHNSSLLTNVNVNQVRVLKDDLWDLSAGSGTFSVVDDFMSVGKWGSYNPRPLPMETAWTKTSFTKDAHGGTTQYNSNYRQTKVRFKPIGTLLRVRVVNRSTSPMSFNSFSLTGVKSSDIMSTPARLTNNLIIRMDQNLTVNSSGEVINTGESRIGTSSGSTHYHYQGLGLRTIAVGESKVLLLWLANHPSVTAAQELKPSLYSASASNHALTDGSSRYYKAANVPSPTYAEGKTYKVNFTYNMSDLSWGVVEWPEGGDAETSGTPD